MKKRNCHHEVITMKLYLQASDHQTNIQHSDKSKRNQVKQFEITPSEMTQARWVQVPSVAIRALSDKNKLMSHKLETSGHIRAVIESTTRSKAQWASQARNKPKPWIICRTNYPKSKAHQGSEIPTKLLNKTNSWACLPQRHTRFKK